MKNAFHIGVGCAAIAIALPLIMIGVVISAAFDLCIRAVDRLSGCK